MKARGIMSTMTEQLSIEDFIIENHLELTKVLIEKGLGSCIHLSPKSETAIKKYLKENPTIKTFPFVKFRQDYKPIYKKRGGQE